MYRVHAPSPLVFRSPLVSLLLVMDRFNSVWGLVTTRLPQRPWAALTLFEIPPLGCGPDAAAFGMPDEYPARNVSARSRQARRVGGIDWTWSLCCPLVWEENTQVAKLPLPCARWSQ